jgi:hypothetical protein
VFRGPLAFDQNSVNGQELQGRLGVGHISRLTVSVVLRAVGY